MIPIAYNIRSLAVRKATTIATALGIALVVFILSASRMLSNGIRNTLGKSGEEGHAIVLRKGADTEMASTIETKQVNLILAAPGVKRDASGAPQGLGELLLVIALEKVGNAEQVANVILRGVPDNALKVREKVKIIAGRPLRPGSDEVIIGKRLRGQFAGLDIGQKFELKKNRSVETVGVFEAGGSSHESEIWGDVDTVRSSFGREGTVSSVSVELESPSKFDIFKTAMERDKQLGLQAFPEIKYFEQQSEGTTSLVNWLSGVIVFFFSVGAIVGAMITMYAAVAHRKREVGTLRALGFSRGTIMASFLLEAVLLALIGGVAGSLASLAMGLVKFSMMNFSSWATISFSFDPTPGILGFAVLVGGAMGVLGGLFPAFAAARTSPVEAMRD
ncbi:MAG TPA: FtsX-like permease family protein [Polyangiales bacterium]|nr:FtsX-like permease family protein [Polyangiales bacterium]